MTFRDASIAVWAMMTGASGVGAAWLTVSLRSADAQELCHTCFAEQEICRSCFDSREALERRLESCAPKEQREVAP